MERHVHAQHYDWDKFLKETQQIGDHLLKTGKKLSWKDNNEHPLFPCDAVPVVRNISLLCYPPFVARDDDEKRTPLLERFKSRCPH
jgi:hypothetical protein